jgi:SpoVK/Ycf46/Vps4 family AAA+-type ATPase
MQDSNDLELIIKSQTPIVVIETYEEGRALELLNRIAVKNAQMLQAWSITEGLRPVGITLVQDDQQTILEPEEALKAIKNSRAPSIYVLCDMHPFLSDEHPKNIRFLKDIALTYGHTPKTIVLISHAITPPAELKHYTAHFQLSLPSDEQIMAIIREEAKLWSDANRNAKVKTDSVTLDKLVNNLRGLTHNDVRMLVRRIVNDGVIDQDDIPEVSKAKFQLLDMDGVLSFEYNTEKFSNIGGLETLKQWLLERKKIFLGDTNGNAASTEQDAPKGILLLGVQGSGKSLAAKAVAGYWGLPLLRLDMAALYNKFIGETERNLREALKMADTMAPCILWMDEIEKGIARDNSDTGTSQRILGTLLTWMAERKSKVFIVATSNNISDLPPELIRKGRLDEIFFVDLPDAAIRESIFKIHLAKRGLDANTFDTRTLAELSEGFSGAEIEQAVVSAIYRASANNIAATTELVTEEIHKTKPISVVMSEQVEQLREWAKDRTVAAN